MEQQNYLQFNQYSAEVSSELLKCYQKQNKLSKLLFCWLNSFVNYGSSNFLQQKDIFYINIDEGAQFLQQNFHQLQEEYDKLTKFNFIKVIFKQFQRMFMILLLNPIIVGLIVELFETHMDIELYGQIICFFLIWLVLLYILISTSTFYEQWVKTKVQVVLQTHLLITLYSKPYPLLPLGELTTLLQLDISQITSLISSSITLLIIPVQIVFAIYVYFRLVGDAAIIGIVSISFNIILCVIYAKIYSIFQVKIMHSRDWRVKGIEELLNGINTIKQNCYYRFFYNRIKEKRAIEMDDIKLQSYLLAIMTFIFSLLPLGVLFSTFYFFDIFSLKSVILVQQSYYQISWAVNQIPGSLSGLLLSLTSIDRLIKLFNIKNVNYVPNLLSNQHQQTITAQQQKEMNQITISNGQFKWNAQPSEDKEQSPNQVDEMEDQSSFELKDINLSINRGETVLIVGSNGSGKSALLYALLREMQQIGDTKVSVNGSVSFAAQEPWIVQASVLENIVLDNELNVERFVKSVEMAQLYYDLEMMPAGHNTDIGEKGQTLSGGQKKRLHLARSLYLEKDIYLLDNPCSALDHSTSQKLIDALRKQLSNKTLIITSNSTEYWEFVDRIVYLEEGKIKFNGTYMEFHNSQWYHQEKQEDLDDLKSNQSIESQFEALNYQKIFSQFDKQTLKLVNQEDRAQGLIEWSIFKSIYQLYGRFFPFFIAGCLSLLSMTFIIVAQLQMTSITSISDSAETTEQEKQEAAFNFVLIFPLCGILSAFFILINRLYLAKKGAQASITLHNKITDNLLKASVQNFYNTIVASRIKNRLTSDIYQFDMNTPLYISNIFTSIFNLLANILACIVLASPTSYPIIALYIYFEVKYTIKYMKIYLQVSRLQAISKSPILNKLTESASGIVYLKHCSNIVMQQTQAIHLIDQNQQNNICSASINVWYLQILQSFMFMMYVLVVTTNYFDPHVSKQAGTISIYLAIQVGETFMAAMQTIQEFYGQSINLERCLFLVNQVPKEDENCIPEEEYSSFNNRDIFINEESVESQIEMQTINTIVNNNELTQSSGYILDLNEMDIKYRDDLGFAIRNFTLQIKDSQKIAIIGRTGSGKTSLIQAMTRLIKPYCGEIYLFGRNYKDIGINRTRSQFSVVSQDPFVFEGSIKQNIDPTDQYSPQEILNQLQTYGFINDNPELDIVETIMNNMDFYIQPNGQNLSLGEKQLIVMCRTVLQRKKIVILDECTGNLDQKYGKLINLMLSLYLKDKTVIGVTHKLDQLELFDSVVLINQGQLIAKGDKDYILTQYLNQNSHNHDEMIYN